MSTNGINEVFNSDFKIKLGNRGPKSSGITFELKSVFDEMAKRGMIKDTDGKGLTKQDALNLYAELNKIHEQTNRATNYTTMQVGQEFEYTADEMKALLKAAGYEIEEPEVPEKPEAPEKPEEFKMEPLKKLDIEIESLKVEYNAPPLERPKLLSEAAKEGPAVEETVVEEADNTEAGGTDKKAERREAREARQKERLENRQKRIDARKERQELKEALKAAEPEFESGGQTGKIIDGKYYINNKEVTKEAFETAQTKALSNEKLVESKSPFDKTYSAEEFAELYNMPIQNVPAENEPAIQSQQKSQPIMTDQQLQEYLANDTSYQAHKKTLQDADNLMKELETKYNFERGDFRGQMNMTFSNEEDDTRYFNAKFIYESYTRELPNYEKEMANWVDGPCGENSYHDLKYMRLTNLERITLSNGQKAWKTDQGVFYPGPNGLPGPNIVPEEYLE